MTVLERVKAHPAVDAVSDERGSGDGFWAYLKTGWTYDNPGEHSLHEDSPSEVLRMLSGLQRCSCAGCAQAPAPQRKGYGRGCKTLNGYSEALGALYEAAPKAVLAAVAVSLLTTGGERLEEAQALLLKEWATLHANGIVPQRPPEARP